MGKKAVLYLRVSQEDMKLENQVPHLERIAAARDLEIVFCYAERMSGSKRNRPALDAMMVAAKRGDFDVVLVWALDRLGRSMPAIVDTIQTFDSVGVSLVSHQETWLDMQGPTRSLLISVMAWVAEQERTRLIERTRAGVARARRDGKTLGRPRRVIDINAVLKLRKDGLSIAVISKRLGVGVGTLHRALASDDVPASARASVRR